MCDVFSCGHRAKVDEIGVDVAIKAYDQEGNNAIDYCYVCSDCYLSYLESDIILENEVEMDKWMRSNYE